MTARAEEQQRLEESVGVEMEHGRSGAGEATAMTM